MTIASATELQGYPRITYGGEYIRGERQFKVAWADRLLLVDELLAYGVFPTAPSCLLNEITVEPFMQVCPTENPTMDPVTTLNAYQWSIVTATYGISPDTNQGDGGGTDSNRRVRQYQPDGSYMEVNATQELEVLTFRGKGMKWEHQDPAVIPFQGFDAVPVRTPVVTWEVVWKRVDSPDWEFLDNVAGTLNDRDFYIPVTGLRCRQGQALFQGFTVARRMDSSDRTNPIVKWEITCRISTRKILLAPICLAENVIDLSNNSDKLITWNHFYRDTPKPCWERVLYTSGDATSFVYRLENWTDLFLQDES